MVQCLVIRCPLCGKESAVPADRASRDVFADRIGHHLHASHPQVSPAGAEEAVRTAVANVEPTELDEDPDSVGGWD